MLSKDKKWYTLVSWGVRAPNLSKMKLFCSYELLAGLLSKLSLFMGLKRAPPLPSLGIIKRNDGYKNNPLTRPYFVGGIGGGALKFRWFVWGTCFQVGSAEKLRQIHTNPSQFSCHVFFGMTKLLKITNPLFWIWPNDKKTNPILVPQNQRMASLLRPSKAHEEGPNLGFWPDMTCLKPPPLTFWGVK